MIYTNLITLSVPESLRDISNSIGKAFDPDTGGDHTFDGEAVDGVITVTFPCVAELAEAIPFFLQSPMALHASVTRDYEIRWVKLTPPSLEDCVLFCEQANLILPEEPEVLL